MKTKQARVNIRSPLNLRARLAVAFTLLLAFASPLTSFGQFPPTLVVAEEVGSMEFSDQVTLIGRTRARASSRIVAVAPGPVVEINVAEGVQVRRGDALMTLDRQKIGLIYQSKKAEAREAQAQAELAEQNVERAEELF
ncbi:MAG: biotin/lipoyl-binding protein, partial [Candidatus Zixiibacteriota bacterium]